MESSSSRVKIKGSSMLKTITSLYTELDEEFRGILDRSTDSRSLLNILKCPEAQLLPSLLACAMKYFDARNNVFRINGMTLCISLEDVLFLTGLPISGSPVISHENRDPEGFSREFGLEDICSHSITKMSSIAKNLNCDEAMRKKAVLLLIVRCFIVPSASGHTLNTTFLKMVQDFKLVDSFA
ncbi:hypothetical protein POM88_024298 [Heracleum sosnowskyi]|uniref:Aminotransferase-like plant mobile domain-containing protein n=1 Tax=Heracleum sosnowskyi TaxID=360622 RepID=A0AAD8MM61_9APIA|nr:hypothetical protein POM88_024298 [Heracleum sosnowskyi]